MPTQIKIFIACSSSLTCMGLRELLSDERDFLIVNETSTVEDTFYWIQKKKPDILLMCAQLIVQNRNDIIEEIRGINKTAKIIVFNSSFKHDQQLTLIKNGVAGIIKSDCSKQNLLKAMRKVYAGDYWFGRDLIPSLINSTLYGEESSNSKMAESPLTKRELEVLTHIATGCKNNEIASKLFVSETTVKTHINSIFKKLKIDDRLQATFYAIKNNILPK